MPSNVWTVFGEAVRGAKHSCLQDAIKWMELDDSNSAAILAVADGHGSAKAFRSNRGASIAVETAVNVISRFISSYAGSDNLSILKRSAYEVLPKRLVRLWIDEVNDDLAKDQITEEELSVLEKADRTVVEADSLLAYGSTLLVVAVNDLFILSLQLGDGDILWVNDMGDVYQPIPADDRCFANETTSLCSKNAWRDFRINFQVITEKSPALVLLATDGYKNSFEQDAGFLTVGTDILNIIKTDGLEEVKRRLPEWLSETSKKGSGDDITVGLIFNAMLGNK